MVKKMKNIRAFYGVLSLLTLVFGMVIYLLFRDISHMLLFKFIPKPDFTQAVIIKLNPSMFSDLLKYNLPYMFWFLSGILFMRFIWFLNYKIQKIYVFCLYCIGFIYVFCKISKYFPGTFDWLDLLFMGIGAFVEGLLYKIFILRRFV